MRPRSSTRPLIAVVVLGLLLTLCAPLPAEAATLLTATTRVRIHKSASSSSATVGYLDRGQRIEAVSTRHGWTTVRFAGGHGYVAQKYLSKRSRSLRVHVGAGSVHVTTGYIAVLSAARSSARRLGGLPPNARVTMTGSSSKGYGRIVYRGSTGWASLRYLPTMTGVLPKVVGTKVATTRLILRSDPDTRRSFGSIADNTRVGVTGVVAHGRAQIVYANKARWVTASYLENPAHSVSGEVVQSCRTAGGTGPRTLPSGAVQVSTSANLGELIDSHPTGTTFWLTAGTHRLSSGQYDQVIPRSGDTFIGAPGAVLDGQHKNLYAFGGAATGVTIKSLTIQNFGAAGDNNNEGVVNHDSSSGWTIESTRIQSNAGAGVMIGSDNTLTGNCLRDNGQYGFNAYSVNGVRNIVLKDNEISGNNTDNWEAKISGCGCTGGGKFWATRGAQVIGNYVHDNAGPGLWADTNNTGFLFRDNYIADNDGEGIFYEISYNAAILDNTLARNGLVAGPKNPGFPTAAIYLSESGSDSRVSGPYGDHLRIAGNHFVDNWAGIVGWENADRFAGSDANTSSGSTTMVDAKATVANCQVDSLVAVKPLFDDCRWKTQNVLVENNDFSLDIAHVPGCTTSQGCGYNGLFSNWGSLAPYQGTVVENNITFHQNNVWRDNTYRGPWRFMAKEMGTVVSWDAWRAAPYGQDAGSSKR